MGAQFRGGVGARGGPVERLPSIGSVEVHPVTEERIDDWLRFFDRDAFPDNPDWGSCYCLHPHTGDVGERPWRDVRAEMIERLRSGATLGYLAYVDGRPAGWVNASRRSTYAKYNDVDPDGPAPDTVVGVSCFIIAPPYRRHGVSSALLDRVVTDREAHGAGYVEGYPRRADTGEDSESFCGPRSMFDARGFYPPRSTTATPSSARQSDSLGTHNDDSMSAAAPRRALRTRARSRSLSGAGSRYGGGPTYKPGLGNAVPESGQESSSARSRSASEGSPCAHRTISTPPAVCQADAPTS